jgi:hypothetical protein
MSSARGAAPRHGFRVQPFENGNTGFIQLVGMGTCCWMTTPYIYLFAIFKYDSYFNPL